MDRLHLGQLGELADRHALGRGLALHLPHGGVHPDRGRDDDGEEQPEAALPDAREVVQRAEGDGQDEAAEAAHEAHHAAHRADAAGVVDGDVLVDRRLAEAHEEAKDEGDDDEADQAHPRREGDGSLDAFHHVGGGRIGEHEGAGDRDQEGPVHYAPRAVLVGEMPAIGRKIEAGIEYIAPIMPAVAMSRP